MTDAKPSKSEKKRQYLELQALGEQLISLTDQQLASIDTDEYLIEQVVLAKKIRAHGALRRQKQLIGKIMRHVDDQPLRAALDRFGQSERIDKAIFRDTEKWRDRLVDEGQPAFQQFLEATGSTGGNVSLLLAQHAASPDAKRRRTLEREIFREVQGILAANVQNTGN